MGFRNESIRCRLIITVIITFLYIFAEFYVISFLRAPVIAVSHGIEYVESKCPVIDPELQKNPPKYAEYARNQKKYSFDYTKLTIFDNDFASKFERYVHESYI